MYRLVKNCDIGTKENCSEKELKFLDKYSKKSGEDQQKQIERLTGMRGNSMKAELAVWREQRINILKQLVAGASDEL